MQSQVAKRYARAFFKLTQDSGHSESEYQSLEKLSQLLTNQQSKALFLNPTTSQATKMEFLEYFLEKIGASPLCRNFVRILNQTKRFQHIEAITKNYLSLMHEKSGSQAVDLYSAVDLNDSELEKIKQQLQKQLNKTITISKNVDPALLGGFVAKFGNKVIDLSLQSKLNALTKNVSL